MSEETLKQSLTRKFDADQTQPPSLTNDETASEDPSVGSDETVRESIMAAPPEKDIADQIETIRADIASLTKTISFLVSESSGIRASLAHRISNATKSTVGAGERFLSEAEEFGNEAIHAATRGATAAVTSVQEEIERNPLKAVTIALGFGFLCGFLSGSASRAIPINAPSRHGRRT